MGQGEDATKFFLNLFRNYGYRNKNKFKCLSIKRQLRLQKGIFLVLVWGGKKTVSVTAGTKVYEGGMQTTSRREAVELKCETWEGERIQLKVRVRERKVRGLGGEVKVSEGD